MAQEALVEDYVRQIKERGHDDSYDLLTPLERELLQLVAEGRSNKDVANLLSLRVYAVKTIVPAFFRSLACTRSPI